IKIPRAPGIKKRLLNKLKVTSQQLDKWEAEAREQGEPWDFVYLAEHLKLSHSQLFEKLFRKVLAIAQWDGRSKHIPSVGEDQEPVSERARLEERLGLDLTAKNAPEEVTSRPLDRVWWAELIGQKTGMTKDDFITWRKKHKQEEGRWPTLSDLE